jgi:hypothetical protein
VSGGRAIWNYVWLSVVNVALFAGAGVMYAYAYRPLSAEGPWVVPVFAVAGLAWALWLARRVNRGKEQL